MSRKVTISSDQSVAQLTVEQLGALIASIVRRVVREELRRDHYVDERGVKILYETDEAETAYLAELQEDYEAIQREDVDLIDSGEILQELRELGVDL